MTIYAYRPTRIVLTQENHELVSRLDYTRKPCLKIENNKLKKKILNVIAFKHSQPHSYPAQFV